MTPPVDSKGARIRHLDLFSGIGGFAYAANQVFGEVEHIFCDNDKFCQQVLTKHWPEAKIYNDIKEITANSTSPGLEGSKGNKQLQSDRGGGCFERVDILTGGFPCQPFSSAGLRRGTADERHLWPEMLRVIRLTQPQWVIAENVRGLLSWNEGLVFEQVCADLEAEGYAVQPLIIPAVAVNAPHRRDRVWFVAHATGDDDRGNAGEFSQADEQQTQKRPQERIAESSGADSLRQASADTRSRGRSGQEVRNQQPRRAETVWAGKSFDWDADWEEVAAELCGMDDGLPARLDGFELTKSKHRQERLKSLGNAIVPQIAMEIMRGFAAPPKVSNVGGSSV